MSSIYITKRAQITVFIIIGIVVLFSIGTILVIQNIVTEKELVLEEPELEKLPEELLPVRNYVDTCIHSVAVDGLRALGEHGGYIDIRDPDNNVNFRIDPSNPTESDAVEFLPGSDLVVPYWGYMSSPNPNFNLCTFSSKRPPLKKGSSTQFIPSTAAIETQLERYMDNNLKLCISDFYTLKRGGFDVQDGDVSTEVTVTDSDVRFIVNYPLSASVSGTQTSVERFYVKIPLELKKIYTLASSLTDWQANLSYLERHALELISIYSGLESDDLPPFGQSGFDFGGGKMWSKAKVKQDVVSMLTSWIRGLQVFGTANFRFVSADPASPYADSINRIYNNMVIPLTGYEDLIVNFDYLDWPIYFDVPNSEGELIKPQSMSNNMLSVIGYQQYETLYDISFPVYIEIKTLPAIDFPDGYRFSFFLEANIRNIEPFSCAVTIIDAPPTVSGNLLCNENQRLSGDVDIKVIDSYTKEPIPGVLIAYNLGDNTCVYSKTNDTGQLKTTTPTALGGSLTAMKNGYLTNSEAVNLGVGESASVVIELYKLKLMNISVKRLTYPQTMNPPLPPPYTTAIKLSNDEEVSLMLTRLKDNPFEGMLSAVGQYSNKQPLVLELAPGRYKVEAQVMLDKRAIIPAQERDDFTMPMIDLPAPHLWGGVKLGEILIKPQKLYEYQEIEFTVLSLPEPMIMEHLQWLGEIEGQSISLNQTALKPKFKGKII